MLLLIAFFHEIRELSFHKMSQHKCVNMKSYTLFNGKKLIREAEWDHSSSGQSGSPSGSVMQAKCQQKVISISNRQK